jgi:acyl carrier protein
MEFDETALRAALQAEWDAQASNDDPFAPSEPANTIFAVQPEIDSLGVVRLLLVVEEQLGFEVPPCIIKRGGYWSFDSMAADILPRLRELYIAKYKKAA